MTPFHDAPRNISCKLPKDKSYNTNADVNIHEYHCLPYDAVFYYSFTTPGNRIISGNFHSESQAFPTSLQSKYCASGAYPQRMPLRFPAAISSSFHPASRNPDGTVSPVSAFSSRCVSHENYTCGHFFSDTIPFHGRECLTFPNENLHHTLTALINNQELFQLLESASTNNMNSSLFLMRPFGLSGSARVGNEMVSVDSENLVIEGQSECSLSPFTKNIAVIGSKDVNIFKRPLKPGFPRCKGTKAVHLSSVEGGLDYQDTPCSSRTKRNPVYGNKPMGADSKCSIPLHIRIDQYPESKIVKNKKPRGRFTAFSHNSLNTMDEDESKHRKYKCKVCDGSFRRRENLKRHFISMHTAEKPYVCKVCNKRFSRADNWLDHEKIHKPSVVRFTTSIPELDFELNA
ncbi:hypothetical protein BABINDRAFT_183561 [Babjeviella inositovora NRRL Y-12698]|uniref:C2H2-type domain-containing protein n=1 Tax=Babjeviella inositovora NRRL Y-12698 TaxID=984486 RepID=A0A1E3QPE2_9ASCO|nr:uncharacterized protein BABINDRAFT_183561 [Babjeviella inositovora NRRL Y-12698]ODQ79576.1 hypothetical protein BABINDRAFT_183561 [Babjeviella inositovora NRRL Y-12698]